ncbi:signal peptidase II [Bacillus paramycoides]|uniref:signal peptidase II n=1 Tax=Bacillus paramycoides TaxID=2026194 RepID=UPI0037F73CA5
MLNKKRHMKVKFWSVRALIIFFFAISAITLSKGVVHLQDVVKEHFFNENESEKTYNRTINVEQTPEWEAIKDDEEGDTGIRTKTNRKFPVFERESLWGDVFSVLSNSWITIAFYVIIVVAIIYFLYKSVRKRLTKTEIEQEKQSVTKENTVRTVKNEKVIHQSEYPLPTETIRKRLVEWERTLPFQEQRRSYETMQQWLRRICRTSDIIPIYESVRYGEKTYTELDVEKTIKWIDGNGKLD